MRAYSSTVTYEDFINSVESGDAPPPDVTEPLRALWYAQKGNWDQAHRVAQGIENTDGSWVHANLHREEGDIGNARYWYSRAGRAESKKTVEEERAELIRFFLEA